MNDIAAPGVSIYSCVPGNKYDIFNGTSMATPHITGSCALVKSIYNEDSESIENRLKENALHLGDEEKFGEGLVQVNESVRNK